MISSSHLLYDLVAFSQVPRTPFYLPKARLWCFGIQSAPSFNFGDYLVPHVQRHDGNLIVEDFSWYTSGKSPACSFRATINSLSNQFFFYFQQLHDPRAHTLNSLSLSLTPSCVYRYKNFVWGPSFQTYKFPWTPLVFIPTCEIFFKDFLENR